MRYQRRFAVLLSALISAQALAFQSPCNAQGENLSPPLQERKSAPSQSRNSEITKVHVAESSRDTQSLQARKPKIGLALGGGGIRGAAHIGVLRELEKEGIKVDYIAGTSIGAIVGGLYSAGLSLDEIEEMVARKSLKKAYYTVPIWFRVMLVPFFMVPHLLGENYDGLYRGNKFANFLNKHVPPEKQNIENLNIPFCAIASSLTDREAHPIKTGNFGRALQASSAIPVLRRPVEINKDLYIDGGIINNLPVDECRAMGADVVIAVSLNVEDDPRDSDTNQDFKQFKKIGSIGNRVINMVLCRVDKDQVKNADVLISPSVNEIRFLSVSEKDAYKAIEAGEVAARAAMAQVKEKIIAF